MKATVTGGVVSDGLVDGRVVSGVGGQFNFVNQAHELDDGRSILIIRSTRRSGGDHESNVVPNYGHLTIPRHLRDIVVTEYGVADLRDRSDAEVIASMIAIADSRFQDDLVARAKEAGTLPADWTVPPAYWNNTPDALESSLGAFYGSELPRFPYGTELTGEELALGGALRNLQSIVQQRSLGPLLDGGRSGRRFGSPTRRRRTSNGWTSGRPTRHGSASSGASSCWRSPTVACSDTVGRGYPTRGRVHNRPYRDSGAVPSRPSGGRQCGSITAGARRRRRRPRTTPRRATATAPS